MSDAVQDLPGFDKAEIERSSEDDAILKDCKHYTAERYLISHKDTAERARRMFFDNPLTSLREICSTCNMDSRTLNALIVMWTKATNARGADFLDERSRMKHAVIRYILTDRLLDMIDDPTACKRAGINGVLTAIKQLIELDKRTSERDPNTNTQTDSTPSAGMDYANFYRSNGLDLKKNSARVVEVVEVSDRQDSSGDQVDKRHASADNNSILLSGGYKDLQGISPTVDNPVDKTDSSAAGDSADADQPSVPGARSTPTRGRGDAGRGADPHPIL